LTFGVVAVRGHKKIVAPKAKDFFCVPGCYSLPIFHLFFVAWVYNNFSIVLFVVLFVGVHDEVSGN
jgi:hypothetical protein